jgi:homoserine kinase type II
MRARLRERLGKITPTIRFNPLIFASFPTMAVFTPVSDSDAHNLLSEYSLGEFVSLKGIAAGIENSNYFLRTTSAEYVLTIFEVLKAEQLPFYIELMHHLAERNIPVPKPQTRQNGSRLTALHNKPAAIVSKLPGSYIVSPTAAHCALTGATLAHAHLAALDFPIHQQNLRGLAWWQETAPVVLPFLTSPARDLLTTSLAEQVAQAQSLEWQTLPKGPSHCDLFRDNVLFAGTTNSPVLGGFIDFYFAGVDAWLFDVAVCINDWCIEQSTGKIIPELASAWLQAYSRVRPFTDQEYQLWPSMLRAAALRFWISRLYDFYLPRPAQTLKPHDPTHFERILSQRTLHPIQALPKES